MCPQTFSRRLFVRHGVASAVMAGIALGSASGSEAAPSETNVLVGRFVRASGAQSASVALLTGEIVDIRLDAGAFVAHGVQGVVSDIEVFVSGEEVAMRGSRSGREFIATEFQSIYTTVAGVAVRREADYALETSSGQVSVPDDVRRDTASGVQEGRAYAATIWTNPATLDATAVALTPSN